LVLRFPGLAEKRQPWAGGLNPFRIQVPDLPLIRFWRVNYLETVETVLPSYTGLKPGVYERVFTLAAQICRKSIGDVRRRLWTTGWSQELPSRYPAGLINRWYKRDYDSGI